MILVTGGTGLVGTHTLYALAKQGKPIRAIKREGSKTDIIKQVFEHYDANGTNLFNSIEWYDADLLDIYSLEEAFKDITHVYHAAAMVSFNSSDAYKIVRDNQQSTANIVNLSLHYKIKKLCHVSSVAAIGRTKDGATITESTEWKSSPENSRYAISKYESEKEVWRGIEEGLDAVMVNPTMIIGPGDWNKSSCRLFKSINDGLKYYTDGINGFVDVRDVVKCMTTLMDSNITAQRYIVVSEHLSYQQIFALIAKKMGKKAPHIEMKKWMGELGWRIEKIRHIITGKEPLITQETLRTSKGKYHYDNSKIKKEIGIEFMPINQSVEDASPFFAGLN